MFIVHRHALDVIDNSTLLQEMEREIPEFRSILRDHLSYSIQYNGHAIPHMTTDVKPSGNVDDWVKWYSVYFSRKLVDDVISEYSDFPLKMASAPHDLHLHYHGYDEMNVEQVTVARDYDKSLDYHIVLQIPNIYFLQETLGLDLGDFYDAYFELTQEVNIAHDGDKLTTQIGGYPFYMQCEMDPYFIMYFYGEDEDIYIHNENGHFLGEMQC